jgi:hypothetical protein
MGELVTEQLHIEVKATVLQNARAKYACRNCERTDIRLGIALVVDATSRDLPPNHGSGYVNDRSNLKG